MAGKIKGLTVVIDGDVTKLSKAIKTAQSESKGLQKELRGVTSLLKFDSTNTTMIAQKQELYSKALLESKSKLEMLKQAEAQYHAQITPHSKLEQQEFRNLQREIVATEQQFGRLRNESIAFGSAASTNTLAARAKMESYGASLEAAGKKMLLVSAGVAYVGYKSVQAAVEFESSFAGVRKTVDATEQEFADLAEASREMSRTKPIDVNDVNLIMELGGQLNIAKENLNGFAGVMSDLDVATDMNIEEGSQQIAKFANITKMNQGDFDRFGSTIVDLGNNSATTESAIMDMGMRIAGSGAQIGLTQPEILALAASLSSVGIEAEMGGSAISKTMSQIDIAVANQSEELTTWANTAGMSVEQFTKLWGEDAMAAIQSVIKGLGSTVDEGGNLNILLGELGITELRQTDTMKRMTQASDILNGSVARANTAWEENTALTDEAGRRYQTTESQLKIMKNGLNDAFITIGQELVPTVRDMVSWFTDAVKVFSELDDGTKKAVIRLGLFAGSIAPVLLGASLIFKGVSKLIGAYASAKTTLNLWSSGLSKNTASQIANGVAVDTTTRKIRMQGVALKVLSASLKTLLIVGVVVEAFKLFGNVMDDVTGKTERLAKVNEAFDSATGGMKTFAEGVNETRPTLAAWDEKLTESGTTVSELKTTVNNAESCITEIIRAALKEQRDLRQEDIDSIKNYSSEIEIALKKGAETFVDAVAGQKAAVEAFENLSTEEAQQEFSNLGEACTRATDEVNSNYQRMRDSLYTELSSGAIDQATFDSSIAALKGWKDSQLAEIESGRSQTAQAILSQWEEMDLVAWQGMVKLADSAKNGIDEYNKALIPGDKEEIVNGYKQSLARLDDETLSGFLAMAASASAGGAELDLTTKQALNAMFETFEGRPGELGEVATTYMREFVSGLEGQVPGLENASSMSADQIISALRDGLNVSDDVGRKALRELVGGMVEETSAGKLTLSKSGEVIGGGVDEGIANGVFNKKHITIAAVVDAAAGMVEAFDPVKGSMETIAADCVITAEGAIRNGEPGFAQAVADIKGNALAVFDPITGEMTLTASSAVAGAASGLYGGVEQTGVAAAANKDAAVAGTSSLPGDLSRISTSGVSMFNSPLSEALGTEEAAKGLPTAADRGAKSSDGSGAGDNFAGGFVNRISSDNWLWKAAQSAASLMKSAMNSLNSTQEAKSPSRATGRSGDWFALGLINKVKAYIPAAYDAGQSFMMASLDGADSARSKYKFEAPELENKLRSIGGDVSNVRYPTSGVALGGIYGLQTPTANVVTNNYVIDGVVIQKNSSAARAMEQVINHIIIQKGAM